MAVNRFGFLLDALRYGAPPHGGIALGIDRVVMLFGGLDNIRDCIAFPKTQRAMDLMTEAPGEVESKQMKELHIQIETPQQNQNSPRRKRQFLRLSRRSFGHPARMERKHLQKALSKEKWSRATPKNAKANMVGLTAFTVTSCSFKKTRPLAEQGRGLDT